MHHEEVHIKLGSITLNGSLSLPVEMKGVVIFSHGSGSSRFSPRNKMVASFLQNKGYGTLLFDLLSKEEDQFYENRFNIDLLTQRLIGATKWLHHHNALAEYPVAYFGASTGAASALKAAAQLPNIAAVISRGGRPDLAMDELSEVTSPTLLIVGGEDYEVIRMNERALAKLNCPKKMTIVEGATHLFEEPGKMEEVCQLAATWLLKYCVVERAF